MNIVKIVPLITGAFLIAAAVSAAPFTLSSPVATGMSETGFDSGLKSAGRLESMYAAGDNGPRNPRSFPFTWSNLPAGTKALALVLDDPDARLVLASRGITATAFLHWIAADLDPAMGGLPDNASAGSPSFVQGKNGAGAIGYIGPQPPSNVPADRNKPLIHVYRLTVYALSAPTGLSNGFSLDDLTAVMKGKTLGQAQLLISYSNG
jgi:Raf kinase inhibitor-like YbhB/YbcL family protein